MNEPEAPQQPLDPPPAAPEPAVESQSFVATMQGVWERIKHHKIVQWTLAYLAVAYTLLHGAEMLTGSLGWPHGWIRLFTLLLILGIPIVVTLAWYHGARGQQRASGTEVMIIAILLALGGAFLWRDSKDHEQAPESVAVATPAPVVPLPVETFSPDEKSIAVLPFADMSPEKNQEYMADGMAEELLNLLAQVPDLKVIARTSSFAFKDQSIDIAEIARKLNVAHVLEGSVRTSGDKLRITAQLVRTADSTHLWSERYDRPMNDIFAVQDEIANSIVQALQIKLSGGSLSQRDGGTQNLEAYQLFLRARSTFVDERSPISLDSAEQDLKQAIELDPNFGRAWSLLSRVVGEKGLVGYMTIQESYAASERYAKRALQVSPNIAEAHAILQSLYGQRDFNWDAAEQEGRKALAIDPNDPVALNTKAVFASALGRPVEAERLQKIAIARDPTNPRLIESLAGIYIEQGRYAEAERLQRSNLERYPNRVWAPSGLARTLLLQGKAAAALEMLELETDEGARKTVLPIVLYAAGRHADADAALKDQIEFWADEYAVCIAETYAYRGDKELALEWLERAYRQKDTDLFAITGKAYFFGTLAGDPRYKAFVRDKLKLPERS